MVLMGKTNATDPMDVDRTEAHQYKTFRRLNNYTRSEAEFVLANYTKFLFVRHPMERFLSAYRNKFADNMTVNARFRAQYGLVFSNSTTIVKMAHLFKINEKARLIPGRFNAICTPEGRRYMDTTSPVKLGKIY